MRFEANQDDLDPLILVVITYSYTEEHPRDANSFFNLAMNLYSNDDFMRDFRIPKIVFDNIVTSIKPDWTRRIEVERAVLCYIWDIQINFHSIWNL